MGTDDREHGTQDPEVTARLLRTLSGAASLHARVGAVAQRGTGAGSGAAEDQAHPLGHHTGILATDYLSTGIEHLMVWERLLLAGLQPYAAHVTLIRAAMECAVTSRWLLEPRADSTERVRRGVALLLQDYANRRDFERDLGIPVDALGPPAKSAAQRHADLRAERDAARLGRVEVPKMTALFGPYALLPPGHGRAIYRLTSAHAHGKQWKGLAASYEVVKDAVAVKGGLLVRVSANDDMSVWLSALAMRVSTEAVEELERYYSIGG